ncbi:MAG: hypothetical protein C4617_02575 [Candidatus Liberibacter europaeus]|uniref:Uncharacterized protein n=1 Tax=Candidatus Liberibacter europaeus TaxID=744859 RepID=A0A2T4VYJ6_9HYPH|nr:hypothetical protein [Candidatus Liberibacter europaeus]PTL86850.1 MAG: hypothetical protein C4617_02575 [Candidatus Liberibacter europaeus]
MSVFCSFSLYAKEAEPTNSVPTTFKPPIISSNTSRGKRIAPIQKIICEARLTEKGPPINSGISWHVFDTSPNKKEILSPIKKIIGGKISLELFAGDYLVSASFGHAGVVKKLTVRPTEKIQNHVFVLNAGGVRLHSIYEANSLILDDELKFSIYSNPNQTPIIIADKVRAGIIVRLGANNYQITSNYGNYNAVVSTIVKVEPGKIIDVTIQNRSAKVTFKLVSEEGGEAIADTAWLISTISGDTIGESIKASPSMILAEGDYVAVARNKDRIYHRDFSVISGKNMSVEILLRQKRMDKLGQNK